MERLLEVLLREASATLPRLAACGCDECHKARRSGMNEGACRAELAKLEDFIASRLRRMQPRGAGAHARLVEDARRFGRVQSRLGGVGLVAGFPMLERRLESYAAEYLS